MTFDYTQAYYQFEQLRPKIRQIADSQNVLLFSQIDESKLTKEQLHNLYQYRTLKMQLNSAYGATEETKQ